MVKGYGLGAVGLLLVGLWGCEFQELRVEEGDIASGALRAPVPQEPPELEALRPRDVAPGAPTGDLAGAIIVVADRSIPSVVHIMVTQVREMSLPRLPFESGSFRFFFDHPDDVPRRFKRKVVGIGSGIIIDREGYILTNNHVVARAQKIMVTLPEGEQFPARVVGMDPKTDLAVVRVQNREPLVPLPFGDSDKVRVGQWVVAIGQPQGLSESVTQGVISAKHRTGLGDPISYQDFLQTDAAINPGNSGGPLLSLDGLVIGVNTAIISKSGGFQGIGFAIPSNMAAYVAKQLIERGEVRRGWLGVSVQEITPQVAKRLEVREGALITGVVQGGPADRAGLERGDIVVAYGNLPIATASQLRNRASITEIGQEVELTVLRNGQRRTLDVRIGSLEEGKRLLVATARERLGGTFKSVSPAMARRLGLPFPMGVVVASVQPGGPLDEAGLEPGDLLLEIDGQPIPADATTFDALVGSLEPGQEITLFAVDHSSGRKGQVQVEMR